MEQKELRRMRGMLETRRQDLMSGIVASEVAVRETITASDSGEGQIDFNHPADMVEGDADYEKELRLLRLQRAELTLVDQALHRAESGEYGDCNECGSNIPVARLEAIPYTKYCIECQQRMESACADEDVRPRFHHEDEPSERARV